MQDDIKKMEYKLGTNVQIGNKILIETGWHKITKIKEDGIEIKGDVFIQYGSIIYGWKFK